MPETELLELAAKERECACVQAVYDSEGELDPASCACRGTGRVARFPGLRETCPCIYEITENLCPCCQDWAVTYGWRPHADKPAWLTPNGCLCSGRGWRPVAEDRALAAVLEALQGEMDSFCLTWDPFKIPAEEKWYVEGENEKGWPIPRQYAGSPLAAAARALSRAAEEAV